jgi:diguanylate cyclase (GGDEF)-like protein/PAS domain S-box-containing protein
MPVNPEPEPWKRGSARSASWHRQNLVRVLFVQCSATDTERCLYELGRTRFTVTSSAASTPEQVVEQLRSQLFDLVLTRYPSKNGQEMDLLEVLDQMKGVVPVILLVNDLNRETAAEFILKGVADCIDLNNVEHLPVAVHRALAEKALREQRDRAEKELRHSQERYRALAGNLSYGICRCTSTDGRFVEVNEAMVRMLGYKSAEQLLAVDLMSEIVQHPSRRARLLGESRAGHHVDPIETEWERKDHGVLKVRLSGREVVSEQGTFEAYEIIVEDVTKQRELEDHLRRLAATDSLTGLANYRRLVDVLDVEIRRSRRTNREFAMLFYDVDGLKQINDQFGHITGSQMLCRVADVLFSWSRDIDTPARFGGDEFALVLPETSADAANLVARRICDSIANDGKGPSLSVSFGVAVYPTDGDSVERLLCQADSALYSMKRQRKAIAASAQASAGK